MKEKKNDIFGVSRFTFQDVILNKIVSFMSLLYLHYQYKHWDSKPGISLFLPGNCMQFMSPEKWEHCYTLTVPSHNDISV